jgi:hypothetical protein
MQTGTNPFACLDAITDMCQVFHADLPHMQTLRLLDNSFGYFVVHVFDMPPLPTRDSSQLPPGSTATVGLETTAMGKVKIPVKPEFPATKDLATTRGGEIVFAHIDTQNATTGNRGDIWNIKDEVKKPLTLSANQLGLFRFTRSKQIRLMLTANKRHKLPPGQGEQGNSVLPQGIGAMIVMDRCTLETYQWDWLAFLDPVIRLQSLVGTCDAMNRIAGHLTAKFLVLISKRPVSQMVQCDTIPAAMLHGKRDNVGASFHETIPKLCQLGRLFLACHQLQ